MSTIQPISTKPTTTHLKSLNTKKIITCADGNLSPGVGQAQKCGCVIPDNGISKGNIVFMASSKKDTYSICLMFTMILTKYIYLNKQIQRISSRVRHVVCFVTEIK